MIGDDQGKTLGTFLQNIAFWSVIDDRIRGAVNRHNTPQISRRSEGGILLYDLLCPAYLAPDRDFTPVAQLK